MNRFCDYIRIMRKKGNIYDPFAGKTAPPPDNDPNGIYSVLVWEGQCKGETTSQNSMLSVSDRMTITIYINENNVEVDNRDLGFFKTNSEGPEMKLQILEVKHYEHNTIIRAMHLKDGDNKK